MAIEVNVDHVTRVLLPDGWHDVFNHSFDWDVFEWNAPAHNPERLFFGKGFTFDGAHGRVSGPVSSILALVSGNHTEPQLFA